MLARGNELYRSLVISVLKFRMHSGSESAEGVIISAYLARAFAPNVTS